MVENNYNTDSAGEYVDLKDEKEVGANCELQIPDESPVPVENVSFSEEANTSEVQYTGSFAQNIAVTGVTYSGSFDIPGNAKEIRDEGWSDDEDGMTLPQNIDNMSIKTSQGTYSFSNVLMNSHSKDIPSDDRTSQSFDFMAEKMVYSG